MRNVLDACAGLPERTFAAGEVVIAEGTPAGPLFILVEGAVEVVKSDVQINTLSDPGSVFGEISILLDTHHTATVRATSPARFHVVENPAEFLRSAPGIALAVARILAKRLHAMTTYLVDLKHQFQEHADHFGMLDEVLDTLAHAQHDDHVSGSDREPDPNC